MMPTDVRPCPPDLTERVLERFGLSRSPEPDLAGLDLVYGAWCRRVPFDNIQKRLHLTSGEGSGPLPGATPEDFFQGWLTHGTGGTCWAGAGALASLLAALGFTVRRGLATMNPEQSREPNHATTVVDLEDGQWIVDASTTFGVPLALDGSARDGALAGAAVRRTAQGETLVSWRPLHKPAGIDFRLDTIGIPESEHARRHEATRAWSLFNYALTARLAVGERVVGIAIGQRVELHPDGSVQSSPLDETTRVRTLVDELGISEEVASRTPPDEPIPPPPGVPPERWAAILAQIAGAAPADGR